MMMPFRVLFLLALMLYCVCGCVLANQGNLYPGAAGIPNHLNSQPGVVGGLPGVPGAGHQPSARPPVSVQGTKQNPHPAFGGPHDLCASPGVPGKGACLVGVPGSAKPDAKGGHPAKPFTHLPQQPLHGAFVPPVPGQFGPAHGSHGATLSSQLNGGVGRLPGFAGGIVPKKEKILQRFSLVQLLRMEKLLPGNTLGAQQESHNTQKDAASTQSHVTPESKQHPTADPQTTGTNQSGLPSADLNTPKDMKTEPHSTTDTVTPPESKSTNGVNTVGDSAKGNTTANTSPDTLNTPSNEESTTTTTTALPPTVPANNKKPNVKGDADSSSSISSVWVRVSLLIVVALACILV
ncbi:hypothetical protein LSM04_000240 [Trypanosoma melophagium]|uniref:uncharacterized protein n=1 Tax=Trypanosoma melophagium TaxID=715481 RepID=UPI00351A4C63|nr:hypothetical protein LSM04_000240 [Trypanosoma melophagium]